MSIRSDPVHLYTEQDNNRFENANGIEDFSCRWNIIMEQGQAMKELLNPIDDSADNLIDFSSDFELSNELSLDMPMITSDQSFKPSDAEVISARQPTEVTLKESFCEDRTLDDDAPLEYEEDFEDDFETVEGDECHPATLDEICHNSSESEIKNYTPQKEGDSVAAEVTQPSVAHHETHNFFCQTSEPQTQCAELLVKALHDEGSEIMLMVDPAEAVHASETASGVEVGPPSVSYHDAIELAAPPFVIAPTDEQDALAFSPPAVSGLRPVSPPTVEGECCKVAANPQVANTPVKAAVRFILKDPESTVSNIRERAHYAAGRSSSDKSNSSVGKPPVQASTAATDLAVIGAKSGGGTGVTAGLEQLEADWSRLRGPGSLRHRVARFAADELARTLVIEMAEAAVDAAQRLAEHRVSSAVRPAAASSALPPPRYLEPREREMRLREARLLKLAEQMRLEEVRQARDAALRERGRQLERQRMAQEAACEQESRERVRRRREMEQVFLEKAREAAVEEARRRGAASRARWEEQRRGLLDFIERRMVSEDRSWADPSRCTGLRRGEQQPVEAGILWSPDLDPPHGPGQAGDGTRSLLGQGEGRGIALPRLPLGQMASAVERPTVRPLHAEHVPTRTAPAALQGRHRKVRGARGDGRDVRLSAIEQCPIRVHSGNQSIQGSFGVLHSLYGRPLRIAHSKKSCPQQESCIQPRMDGAVRWRNKGENLHSALEAEYHRRPTGGKAIVRLSDLLLALQRLGIGVEPAALSILSKGQAVDGEKQSRGVLDIQLSLEDFKDTGAFLAACAEAAAEGLSTNDSDRRVQNRKFAGAKIMAKQGIRPGAAALQQRAFSVEPHSVYSSFLVDSAANISGYDRCTGAQSALDFRTAVSEDSEASSLHFPKEALAQHLKLVGSGMRCSDSSSLTGNSGDQALTISTTGELRELEIEAEQVRRFRAATGTLQLQKLETSLATGDSCPGVSEETVEVQGLKFQSEELSRGVSDKVADINSEQGTLVGNKVQHIFGSPEETTEEWESDPAGEVVNKLQSRRPAKMSCNQAEASDMIPSDSDPEKIHAAVKNDSEKQEFSIHVAAVVSEVQFPIDQRDEKCTIVDHLPMFVKEADPGAANIEIDGLIRATAGDSQPVVPVSFKADDNQLQSFSTLPAASAGPWGRPARFGVLCMTAEPVIAEEVLTHAVDAASMESSTKSTVPSAAEEVPNLAICNSFVPGNLPASERQAEVTAGLGFEASEVGDSVEQMVSGQVTSATAASVPPRGRVFGFRLPQPRLTVAAAQGYGIERHQTERTNSEQDMPCKQSAAEDASVEVPVPVSGPSEFPPRRRASRPF